MFIHFYQMMHNVYLHIINYFEIFIKKTHWVARYTQRAADSHQNASQYYILRGI